MQVASNFLDVNIKYSDANCSTYYLRLFTVPTSLLLILSFLAHEVFYNFE